MNTREWIVFVDSADAPGEGETVRANTAGEALDLAVVLTGEPKAAITVYPKHVEAPESHGAA
jgi:hypothetical protein